MAMASLLKARGPRRRGPGPRQTRRPVVASGVRAVVSFAQEYAYVAGDLKRLGLTAVGLFAVLVVLSFIIR